MSDQYEDILYRSRPVSKRHHQMEISDRAAQFMPFAALVGYNDLIREASRLTQEKKDLSDTDKEEIKRKLDYLQTQIKNKPLVTVQYFIQDAHKQGGYYQTIAKPLKKIDEIKQRILFMDQSYIQFDDIVSVEYEEM